MTDETPPGSTAPQLTIDAPETSPNDEPIAVQITGADPGERVRFEATLVDHDGVEWRSRATFDADGSGIVDLTGQAPVSGTYEGVEPMGWLWSMATDADARGATLDAEPTVEIELRAATDGRRAERTIVRRLYDETVTIRTVDRDDLAGMVFEPPGENPHPGVLLLHGSGGRLPTRAAQLLATHGYAVFAVRYVGDHQAVPAEHRRVPLSYFDDAAAWFRQRSAVAGGQIGVMGGSRGGELALLLGSRFEWVGAVVALAASGVAWDSPSDEPGWVEEGAGVPHLEGKPIPRETVAGGLEDEPVAEAAIPVEKTDGPILLVSGGDDRVWPARRLSEIAVDRLERAGFEHRFAHLHYEDAGHLISVPYAPLTGFEAGGGTPQGTAHAAEGSWPGILRTLGRI
ncbi:acyl-CoA thioester hydrolase/BAAT C-terminal domain-containing protein [Halapricum hydrolyticum]|uniref:Acyl-CoA thioesterase/BAAT N-terminal domain-containing protein n=1 Tax=Halapricum hydrolyticum TaxID=2979991 RepID=A0AAE3IGS1_9EURY|nr:acyl-CoA thioester hydrolase/BAAT C-terminal domain-containing protein [Halapricum hydrolyticum]MCU4719346.1 acyl-CoA thioesterase/BAAT N-terminal domain-containing protein [Halapricum hydrolyticum]MCU4728389.1 acyl-CoA thioesterase/BAAT N-terminal domain-containing protein [Halapricum hydrolyticum]